MIPSVSLCTIQGQWELQMSSQMLSQRAQTGLGAHEDVRDMVCLCSFPFLCSGGHSGQLVSISTNVSFLIKLPRTDVTASGPWEPGWKQKGVLGTGAEQEKVYRKPQCSKLAYQMPPPSELTPDTDSNVQRIPSDH